MFVARPVEKLSKQVTEALAATSMSQSQLPRNPAPPVTRTRLFGQMFALSTVLGMYWDTR